MNLLFSLDTGYIPVFLNCLKSILKNGGSDSYSFYILHSDLDASHMDYIQQHAGGYPLHFIQVDPAVFEGFPISDRYPLQIYYRLAAPLLLPQDLERILYLDGDITIINPLKELYEMDFEGCAWAACSHTRALLNSVNQLRLGMEEAVPYINSGVLLYNLPILRKHLSLQDIQQYADRRQALLFLPDQDILTALYGTQIKTIDWRKYNLAEKTLIQNNLDPTRESIDYDWIEHNTVVIHYCGKNKPWKTGYTGELGDFYWKAVRKRRLLVFCTPDDKFRRSVCRKLQYQMPQSAWLSSYWCWNLNGKSQQNVSEIMQKNAGSILESYLECEEVQTLIFSISPADIPWASSMLESLYLHGAEIMYVYLKSVSSSLLAVPSSLFESFEPEGEHWMLMENTGLSARKVSAQILGQLNHMDSGL